MKLKKTDVILVAIVCVIAIGGLIVYSLLGNKAAGTVVVEVDGEIFGEYAIAEDHEVKIHDTNVLKIEDGIVRMESADCPDQICVEHRPISKKWRDDCLFAK